MSTYSPAINELRKKTNVNLVTILRYIAKEEGFIESNRIEYSNLYKEFLLPKFKEYTRANNIDIRFSRKQFRRMRYMSKGKFPINICTYLLFIYYILYDYNKKLDVESENGLQYSEYIIKYIRYYIDEVLAENNIDTLMKYCTEPEINTLNSIADSIRAMDMETSEHSFKLYNDIW